MRGAIFGGGGIFLAFTDPKTSLKIDFRKKHLRGKFFRGGQFSWGGHFFGGGAFFASTFIKTCIIIEF